VGFFSSGNDSDVRKTLDDVVKSLNTTITLLNEVGAKVADLRIDLTALTKRVASLEKKKNAEAVRDADPVARRRVPTHATRVDELPIGDDTHIDLGSGGDCGFGVVGESHRQAALRELAGARLQHGETVRFVAELIPELDNQFDPNAIKVCAKESGAHIAYISRDDAIAYQPIVQALSRRGCVGICRAKLIGGTAGKPSIGVQLDLCPPPDLLSRLGGAEAF
jgi:hypothetical protein